MTKTIWLTGCMALLLAGCETYQETSADPDNQFIQELPEEVVAIAAPYQDLTAVRVNPDDGCLIYRHVGPVETTFLPLRTRSGRPICTRQPDAQPTG